MKKILILDQAEKIGGAELFNLNILENFDSKKFDITLFHCGKNNDFFSQNLKKSLKIKTTKMPAIKPKNIFKIIKSVIKLNKKIKKIKPDLIWANTTRSHILIYLVKKFFNTKSKIAFVMHDFSFPKKLFYFVVKSANIICPVSFAVKNYYKPIARKTKIKNIKNFVDLLPPKKIKKKEIHVANIGRFIEHKGQKKFIKIAKKVLAINPNYKFFLIGDYYKTGSDKIKSKKYYDECVKMCKNYKDKIIFTGFLKNIYEILQKIDVLVQTNQKSEPFGRSVIEAGAMYIPCIAERKGGYAETIIDKKTGFFANGEDDFCKKLLTLDKKKIEHLGKNAHDFVEKNYNKKSAMLIIEKIWLS